MMDRHTNDMLLPIEYSIGKAFTIYLKRLMLIIAIALINYIIFALVIIVTLRPILLIILPLLFIVVYGNRINLLQTMRSWFTSQITIKSSIMHLSSLTAMAAVSLFVLFSIRYSYENIRSATIASSLDLTPLPTINPPINGSDVSEHTLDHSTPTPLSEICGLAVVISDLSLRVRSEASTSSEILIRLPSGSQVIVLCEAPIYADGYWWVRIQVEDLEGYAAREFLRRLP